MNLTHEEVAKKYIKDPASYIDNYKIVKYKDIKYYIGDTLLIRNHDGINDDFICKLLRIIRPIKTDLNKVLAFLEVQWYISLR